MRILRLEPDDVIIPPFAVIAVTVATQGETLLLTLFSFCGESGTVSDWTDPLVLEGDEDMDCLFFFFSSSLSLSISAVFCDKNVILGAQERLSSLAVMHIHRLTDIDKVEVTKFEKYRIHVFQNVHNTVSNNRILSPSGP